MYYLAENLEVRRTEFIERIHKLTGCGVKAAETEVDLTLQRLFHWAAYSDKYGGTVQVTHSVLSTKDFHVQQQLDSFNIEMCVFVSTFMYQILHFLLSIKI